MLFWLSIIGILTFIEATTINLVTIWYVISGIVALLVSLFVDDLLIQVGIFVILGTVLLILSRPLLKKYINKNDEKTNFDRVIGMQGIVTESISKFNVGEVKVDGKRWSAISDDEIAVGSTVRILEINGVKLIVKKDEE